MPSNPYPIKPTSVEDMARQMNRALDDLYNRALLGENGKAKVTVNDIDTTPPDTPANLTLTTGTASPLAYIEAKCDPVDDASGYSWKLRKVEGDITQEFPSTEPEKRFDELDPGQEYGVKVAAVNALGQWSEYTEEETTIAEVDTIGPSAPYDVTANIAANKIRLEWTDPPDDDLAFIEIWSHTSNTCEQEEYPPTNARLSQTVRAGTKDAEYATRYGDTRYHWLIGKDKSDNAGEWSHGSTSGVTATVSPLKTSDLASEAATITFYTLKQIDATSTTSTAYTTMPNTTFTATFSCPTHCLIGFWGDISQWESDAAHFTIKQVSTADVSSTKAWASTMADHMNNISMVAFDNVDPPAGDTLGYTYNLDWKVNQDNTTALIASRQLWLVGIKR